MSTRGANDPGDARAVYLDHKGWFYVVHRGNRSIYYGPYRDEETANRDGYKAYHNDVVGA